MSIYHNNKALIAAVNHANLKNGEVIIKLNNEIITGDIKSIQLNMRDGFITEFTITGLIAS